MMCGLQGSGKTTTCGKHARLLLSQGQHPMLVAADLQRPAAIEQLKTVGAQVGVPVYAEASQNPVQVCAAGIKEAEKTGKNIVILDTAGRLHVDDALMKELESIDKRCNPHQCYLVVDSLTGQDAVNSAKAFNDALSLDGVILTKLDGDSRGGAALSIKEVTGVPIKFVGMGRSWTRSNHSARRGWRRAFWVWGMCSAWSIKPSRRWTRRKPAKPKRKWRREVRPVGLSDSASAGQVDGVVQGMLELIPGMSQMLGDDDDPEGEMGRVEAIISSMTPKERAKPEIIDHSRRRRIAKGSGTEPHEVNKLIKMFEQMRGVMQGMAKMSMMDRVKMMMGCKRRERFRVGSAAEERAFEAGFEHFRRRPPKGAESGKTTQEIEPQAP